MLTAEFDIEVAKNVWQAEAMEKGVEKGLEKGVEKVALSALAKGMSLEMICDITGLDMETLKNLASR